ncbi:kinetochore CENP-C fungal-like protein [Chaetomidium leptoderma]|uniref:CENP-C homolog n=1 Tax=Chaetomidium leptoderma TaxID=669021 RepID=A0AAN6VSB6_9PEZI|nr:kinetochore CENP-C fungal-like protein [Chaetomidium leptoderma]
MAPRPSMARRTIAPQGEHIYDLGVVGRKTGVTVPDSGVRDEHGMEPIEDLFSSPGKSDHENQEEEVSDEYGSGEEAMDITTTSGIGPAALLNGHGSRLPVSVSRVRSPTKTLLNSPAQRIRSIARHSSSPARGAVVRDDGSRSSSQPTGDHTATKRRLDFRSVANGGPHSLSQPLAGNRLGAGKGLANSHRLQPVQYVDDEEEEEAQSEEAEHGGGDDEVNDFVEESMAMLNEGDDYTLPEPEPEPAQSEGEEEQTSIIEDADPPAPVARKRPGRPPKQKTAAPAKAAKPQKKPAGPAAVEEDVEEEEEEPTPKPQKPTPGRRGRPPKASKAAAAPPQPPARSSKKRRSLDEEEAAASAEEPSPEPQPKRQRTSPAAAAATNSKNPAPKKPAASSKKTAKPPAAAAPAPKPRGGGRKRKSSPIDNEPGDVSQVAIARRPPLPKSRGLLINRREVHGDPGSSMHRTRSGRTSFKPLAYWRNERVECDQDEAEDAFRGRTRKGRFVLPSTKGVVRVDEPEPEVRAKSYRSKKGGGATGKRGRPRGRRSSRGFEDEDQDDGPAEVWELDPGTVTGEVVVWQPEYEFSPPAPNDLVSVMDKQLAISAAAIKTTEVVGGEFRYAKVFSEGFIGAGVVDLPPGAIKRLKNSRKVFMIFFVHVGRVLVTVQETSFRISKGGIFIVPRYNEYTVENDYDQPARIFFAQGQEMPANPPPEGAAEEEDDVDEEVEVTVGEEEEDEEEEGSEEE